MERDNSARPISGGIVSHCLYSARFNDPGTFTMNGSSDTPAPGRDGTNQSDLQHFTSSTLGG